MTNPLALSHQTVQNLREILTSSIANNIVSLGGVKEIPSESWPVREALNDSCLIVLTLSAYRFQGLMCLLAVADHATVDLNDDYLKELANNLCGTFKRHLGQHIPILGMSTPNRLQLECLPYLETLLQNSKIENCSKHNLVVHCVDSKGVSFFISLIINGNLDIQSSGINTGTDTTGELELF